MHQILQDCTCQQVCWLISKENEIILIDIVTVWFYYSWERLPSCKVLISTYLGKTLQATLDYVVLKLFR